MSRYLARGVNGKRREPTTRSLKLLLEYAHYRAQDADKFGWPALAQSWRQDEASARAELQKRGVMA